MAKAAVLRTVLGSQTNDKAVLAEALLKTISTAGSDEERSDLMSIALLERDSVSKNPKSLPNKGLDQNTWDQLAKTHSDIVDGFMKMAFSKSKTAKDFALEILRLLDFVADTDATTYAFARVLFSPYVPFQQLPGTPVHMTNADYNHKLASEPKQTSLVDYISALPFDERTERASMLLQVIDDTQDKDLRVALLAHALARQEERVTVRLLKAIGKGE
jgi:hypothetical protein